MRECYAHIGACCSCPPCALRPGAMHSQKAVARPLKFKVREGMTTSFRMRGRVGSHTLTSDPQAKPNPKSAPHAHLEVHGTYSPIVAVLVTVLVSILGHLRGVGYKYSYG